MLQQIGWSDVVKLTWFGGGSKKLRGVCFEAFHSTGVLGVLQLMCDLGVSMERAFCLEGWGVTIDWVVLWHSKRLGGMWCCSGQIILAFQIPGWFVDWVVGVVSIDWIIAMV